MTIIENENNETLLNAIHFLFYGFCRMSNSERNSIKIHNLITIGFY